ncbi:GDP-fucose protein O-fucosyltransferase 2 [Eufriesea mexicana]|uniref:GDP-fucose protein O-fucosyltransferase 2 n=1 Tax=Eufriesea mexicana TaxID=516756 RepID=UPI00083C0431|nr:PREDICTED: GDP-fucose protein O-fucosyltransferase 2 [Eufriesea mexicana]OAD55705.1 GDP-fucose protein O-fucosyltransferase 2 [Eufriesea mexicana]
MLFFRVLCFVLFSINFTLITVANEFCDKSDGYEETNNKCNIQLHYSRNRYILYDVNPVEGFNLRRDVFIRIAVFTKNLIKQEEKFKWQLVLPPWGNLYHWRSKHIGFQTQLPWSLFFDILSLQRYVPIIEMHQFLQEYPSESNQTHLDIIYILQNDEEMFKTGIFEDKNEVTECTDKSLQFYKVESEKYVGNFWGYHNITSKIVKCIKFHGMMSGLKQNLKPNVYRSVIFDHIEIALHDFYGTREYWKARRSMRYNFELYDIANEYRKKFLNSTNLRDKTERPDDWTKEQNRRNAIGGPYLSVHLRRRDFLVGRPSTIPTIKSAAFQLKNKLYELKLKFLFVATDATWEEFNELKGYLSDYIVLRFIPSDYVLNKFKDGGIAIIDQIISSYARYFIGTFESTFTFRIQEDREIIGFPTKTTFNYLCKDTEKCDSNGQWEIVW